MKKLTKLKTLLLILALALSGSLLTACETHQHTKGEYLHTLQPTCEAAGYNYYSCSTCGDGKYLEYIPRLGHDFKEYACNNDATCEENATETAVCHRAGCEKIDTREIANSALGIALASLNIMKMPLALRTELKPHLAKEQVA